MRQREYPTNGFEEGNEARLEPNCNVWPREDVMRYRHELRVVELLSVLFDGQQDGLAIRVFGEYTDGKIAGRQIVRQRDVDLVQSHEARSKP